MQKQSRCKETEQNTIANRYITYEGDSPKKKSEKNKKIAFAAPAKPEKETSSPALTAPPKNVQMQPIIAGSYTCPGLHGPDCRQVIERRSFYHTFVTLDQKVVIPLFQRLYCWTPSLASSWFRDSGLGSKHQVGRAVYTLIDESEIPNAVLCVDGQQRMTTTMLLLASMRDRILQIMLANESCNDAAKEVVEEINSVLFRFDDASITVEQWVHDIKERATGTLKASEIFPVGKSLSWSRLSPSYVDRQPFYEAILGGVLRHVGIELQESEVYDKPQLQVKRQFDILLEQALEGISPTASITWIRKRYQSALRMVYMYIQPLNELNLAQVFLYLQEKSLVSLGALLHNPTPGVKFNHSDLVRNQLLSCFMNESHTEQERVHNELWLQPFELQFCSVTELNNALKLFLDEVDRKRLAGERKATDKLLPPPPPTIVDPISASGMTRDQMEVAKLKQWRHVSPSEEKMYAIMAQPQLSKALGDLSGLQVFARFCSLYEEVISRPEHSHAEQQQLTRRFVVEMREFTNSLLRN